MNELIKDVVYFPEVVKDFEFLEVLLTKKLSDKLKKAFKYDMSAIVNADRYSLSALGFTEVESAKVLSIKNVMLSAHKSDLYKVSDFANSPEAAYKYFELKFGSEQKEFFSIIFLNSGNKILSHEILFTGTIDQAQIYPREVIKRSILNNAAAIILVHNHPSGNCKPSDDDIVLTARLRTLLKEVGVNLHDHLVVSSSGTFSIQANRKVS
jgi:DNA repair protein RadC